MQLEEVVERFWSRVDRRGDDECWLWNGSTDGRGYGMFTFGPYRPRAHQFSYRLHHGRAGANRVIRHICGNPGCVNPSHLKAGTHQENMMDRSIHGRHGLAKVTPEMVRSIREQYAAGEQQKALAQQFGIHQTTISQIVRRVTWTHV